MSYRSKRRAELDEIARELCINPSRYKNKTLLIKEIVDRSVLPRSSRCYNTTDPSTLESIDDIPEEDYIEWTQIRNRFGASKTSVRNLINNNLFILPWAVDFYTKGNIKSFEKELDMRENSTIKKYIRFDLHEFEDQFLNLSDVPFSVRLLFEIEGLTGPQSYAEGNVINKIVNEDDITTIFAHLHAAMIGMLNNLSTVENLIHDAFHQMVYSKYKSSAPFIVEKEEHLSYLIQLLKEFTEVVGPQHTLLDTFFSEL